MSRRDGTFGLKFYKNETMNGARYHVLPELRQWNWGDLDRLVWQQVNYS